MLPYSFAKKVHMHLEHMRTLASAAVSENDVNNTKTASGPSAFNVAAALAAAHRPPRTQLYFSFQCHR